ncbi:MAG: H(+)/Cl(-) exchange transporter ClcA [Sphingobacteriales bacterium]|nr:MAG: H(+)/Cl(-) exchange transporter ClcA [Sphingobacteriales bacterium]
MVGDWKFKRWRFTVINKQQFNLLFFSLVIGLITGITSAVFRLLLAHIDEVRNLLFTKAVLKGGVYFVYVISFSIFSVLVSLFLVKRFAKEAAGSGVQIIEGALDNLLKIRWKKIFPVKLIGSIFSLGSGFLLGREGPTIQIGAGIGKMIKDIFKLEPGHENPLISAGAAAGLASAFNAPLSGILFVIEEMHEHFKYSFNSVASIMIATGTADFVVRSLIGADPVIGIYIYKMPPLNMYWIFVILGLFLSFIGFAFNYLLIQSLNIVQALKGYAPYLYAISIGVIIIIVGFLNPDFIGGGYGTIHLVLDHTFNITFLLLLFSGRFLLTILSYSTGLPGGIFAPLLAIGVVTGTLFGHLLQHTMPILQISVGVFAVAGMAGIFSATIKAPLTGIMLAVEMTSDFQMVLPLIFTCFIASTMTTILGNQPVYSILLKRVLNNPANSDIIIQQNKSA